MLNYTFLPDLLVLTILVLVFWSILRRRAGGWSPAWLWAWVFVVLHFAILLITGKPGIVQTSGYALSAVFLDLAGATFIYAAGGGGCSPRMRWIAVFGVCATVAYIALDSAGISTRTPYLLAAAWLLLCAGFMFMPDAKRTAASRNIVAIWGVLLAIALGALAVYRQQDYGEDCIFFVIYLLAGILYWKNFTQRTTGSITATGGFLAWAAVFPSAVALELLRPDIHVQPSVWNIPKYIVAIGILMTLLEEEITRTEHLALHDALTGLPNRRLLEDRLTKAVERAERNEARVAILLIDLDGFKQINDTYGHPVGDQVLREVAKRLQMRVRKADTIARAGGDEFLVVVSDLIQPQGADVLASKLAADLNEPIPLENGVQLRCCASIGVAIYPEDGQTVEALCAKSDAAMYDKKRRSSKKSQDTILVENTVEKKDGTNGRLLVPGGQ
jgi:diguanylate cyclase (GGDEF)-like protein